MPVNAMHFLDVPSFFGKYSTKAEHLVRNWYSHCGFQNLFYPTVGQMGDNERVHRPTRINVFATALHQLSTHCYKN